MKKPLIAALALATILLPTSLLAAPAQAASRAHAIRYVSVDDCGRPCATWRVTLGDGTTRRFSDAQVHPLSKHGKPIKGQAAPIGVSGDGRRVAYLRAGDGRLVVRDLGGALYPMPRGAFRRGVSQGGSNMWLSLDGARLAVSQHYGRVRLYDVASGTRLATLPKGEEFLGFSGDGDEVLTRSGEHTLHSRTLSGRLLATSKVKSYGPFALNPDGVTVAWLTGDKGKQRAVLWDLSSDRPNVRTWIWIPDYRGMVQRVEMLDWTANKQLTLHVRDDAMRTPAGMHVLLLDLGTSRFTLRDRYTVRSSAWGFEACGG
ncbi:WD40 repeat domain-containing protein [Nonomuraea sediminis]|uniref:WD40 repeat domain-containing protein n=1 Tax=Nonomuraea sediminis TaxID=2835864 RepID=UPI001BDD181A|nr:WD40 repeat domain-containing protein [Nonomuraea sediminis]